MYALKSLAGACAGLALFAHSAWAQSGAEPPFYEGKDIRLIISSDVGGGYDAYSRVLAEHLPRHIPGEPNIIVQNMPGAGGLVATNFVYNVAPKDGTVIANVQRGVPFMPILGLEGPQFDPTKFNWIGSLNNEVGVMAIWHTSDVKTLEDARENEVVIGGSGPNDTELSPRLLNDVIGTKFKIISGYPSSSAITLAMERGEVEGFSTSYSALKTRNADWIKDDKVSIIVQNATKKHPDLPDVPIASEFADTDEERQVLDLYYARQAIGRPFLAPPGVPEDRVEILREAFDAMIQDPDFRADMEKQNLELNPVGGEEIQDLIDRVVQTPQPIVDRLVSAGFGEK